MRPGRKKPEPFDPLNPIPILGADHPWVQEALARSAAARERLRWESARTVGTDPVRVHGAPCRFSDVDFYGGDYGLPYDKTLRGMSERWSKWRPAVSRWRRFITFVIYSWYYR